jgi:putative membrane-bound dehydrogenase-like protein
MARKLVWTPILILCLPIVLGSARASSLTEEPPGLATRAPERDDNGPKSPRDSLDLIRVAPGFRVELVASEPQVADPIAFDWGPDGRLWVVEMGDYPLGMDGKGSPGGVVKFLEDRDGDGFYEYSCVFLANLGFPTGVMPWRKGVLISRAPDILYAEDVDGDGHADRTEVLLTGFVPGNPQHRLNGFDIGLDGLVYGANGESGGTIRSSTMKEGLSIRGRDFRFDPDARRLELESGQTQFGRHRDDWGHWFGINNSVWGWHFVLSERALTRNPSLNLASPQQHFDLSPQLFPDSVTAPRFNSPGSANKVTSANSPTPYRDDLFGPVFAASLFVSEPVHNLIRRMSLITDGPTFRATAEFAAPGKEFLASADPWFRPTMLRTGPDGGLWIADMYRAVIEHPEWIPDDQEAKIDLRAGADQGRIYRVVPVGTPRRPIPRLDNLDTAGLVAALDSPSGWQRDTAQRLLGHRRDPDAIALLQKLARSSSNPKTRMQALWTLQNLGGLDRESAEIGLQDKHPQVRRAAIEAGGSLLPLERLTAMVGDADPEVRFAVALALGDLDGIGSGTALVTLIRRDGQNPWFRAAILSSAVRHTGEILTGLFDGSGVEGPPPEWVEPLFALASSSKDLARLEPLLESVNRPTNGSFSSWQFSAAAGLAEAADRSRSAALLAAFQRLSALLAATRSIAGDQGAAVERRIEAIRPLGRSEADRPVLAALLKPQEPEQIQRAALRSLTKSDDKRVAESILDHWKELSPGLRGAALDALLGRSTWTFALLSSLEDRCVPAGEIPSSYRRRLLEQADAQLRARASAIFDHGAASSRREVLDAYRPALATLGDPASGSRLFRKSCVACHRLEGVGNLVGPDLLTLSDISPETMLVAILDPNRAFEAKYMEYSFQLKDGRTVAGVIASETAGALALKRVDGQEEVVLRTAIEGVSASGRSLMPEGLEKEWSPRDLADFLAYLKELRSTSKREARPK